MMKALKIILKTALCILLIFGILLYIPSFLTDRTSNSNGRNWLKSVADDTLLYNINIPGTHDSCTKYNPAGAFSACQSRTISEQLNMGVRFLDIRLKKTESGFVAVHAAVTCLNDKNVFAYLTAENVIDDCLSFLKENPTETILFMIKEDSGNAGNAFFDSFYKSYVDENWYTENRVPTLGEVRGKIVLIRRCGVDKTVYDDALSGLNFSVWPDQGSSDTADYKTFDTESTIFDKANINVQDRYSLPPSKKTEAANKLFSNAGSDEFNLNYLSTAFMLFPCLNASKLNDEFRTGGITLPSKKGYIVIFDFVSSDIAEKVYMSNFSGKITD